MQVYVRKRRRSSSPALIFTHVLCFLIGFSACYALFWASSGDDEQPQQAQEAETPDEPSEQMAALPVDPPPEEPPVPEAQAPPQDSAEPEPIKPPPAKPEQTDPDAVAEPGQVADMEDTWPARHLFIKVKGTELDEATREFLAELKPGGVVLQGENVEDKEQTTTLISQIKVAVGLGTNLADLPLMAVDQEGGLVNRLKLDPAPAAADLAKQRDLVAVREVGLRYAQACQLRGIAVMLAPVMDVYEPGAESSMASRCFGRNNSLVTAMGLAFADGVMSEGVLSVAKHYPGHGAARQDSHVALAVIEKEAKELAPIAAPFINAAGQGIPGIMVGHIAAPAVSGDDPMLPASLSPFLIRTILRERYLYDGVIITDDLAMGAITASRTLEEAAVEALNAGCDALIMLDPDPQRIRSVCDAIGRAVEDGALSRDALQESKRRLDAWQDWLKGPAGLKRPLPDLSDVPEDPEPEVAVEPELPSLEEEPVQAPAGTKEVTYEIRPGDSLSKIAGMHGVSVDDVMAWNRLMEKKIVSGRKLTLYVPDADEDAVDAGEDAAQDPELADEGSGGTSSDNENASSKTEEVAQDNDPQIDADAETTDAAALDGAEDGEDPQAETAADTQEADDDPLADSTQEGQSVPEIDIQLIDEEDEGGEVAGDGAASDEVATEPPAAIVTHVVSPGDTLTRIANRYDVSADAIVELNNIKDRSKVLLGQKLKIPKR